MTSEKLDVVVPDYVNRFLSNIAVKTGKEKEDVALFFLLKKAVHARTDSYSAEQNERHFEDNIEK